MDPKFLSAQEQARREVLALQSKGNDKGISIGGCACGSGQQVTNPMVKCGDPTCDGLHCYDKIAQAIGCQLVPIGATAAAIAAGTALTFSVQPTISDFFLPVRAQMESRDDDDPTIVRPVKLTAVTIGAIPQWCLNNTAPTTNAPGIWSDAMNSNKGRGVPVNWGPFSITNRSKRINFTVFNPAAGPDEDADVNITIWGYCIDDLPKPLKCGVLPAPSTIAKALDRMAA